MDISTHRHWGADWLDVGLLQEEITDQVTQLLQLSLRQIFAVLMDDPRLVSSLKINFPYLGNFYPLVYISVLDRHNSLFLTQFGPRLWL